MHVSSADSWKAARPQDWPFSVQPMTARQLTCHAAAHLAEINKRVSLYTLRQLRHHRLEQNTDIRFIQVLLCHAKLEKTRHVKVLPIGAHDSTNPGAILQASSRRDRQA